MHDTCKSILLVSWVLRGFCHACHNGIFTQCIMWESLAVSYVYFSQNLLQNNLIDNSPYFQRYDPDPREQTMSIRRLCSLFNQSKFKIRSRDSSWSWLIYKIPKLVSIGIDLFAYDNRSDDSCKFHLPITSGSVQVSVFEVTHTIRVSQW